MHVASQKVSYSRKQKVIPYQPPVVAGVDLSFTISNTKDIILEEDDIYYYTYDVDRLYSLLDTIFHKDCRHYVTDEAHQERDGVIAFNQIRSHVFGQHLHDITSWVLTTSTWLDHGAAPQRLLTTDN